MAGTKHNQPTKPFAELPMSLLETISNHFVTVRQTALHPIIECFNKAFRTFNDLLNSVIGCRRVCHYPQLDATLPSGKVRSVPKSSNVQNQYWQSNSQMKTYVLSQQ